MLSLLHKDMEPYVYHKIHSKCHQNTGDGLWPKASDWPWVSVQQKTIIQVSSYKHLGVHIDSLCWKTHGNNLCNRLQQRHYFLRGLRLHGVSRQIMLMFYWAILESILRYGVTIRFGNLTVQLKSRLTSMHKTAIKIIGKKEYEPIQSLYEQAVRKQATKIIVDSQHPLFSEYELMPSGRRFHVPKCKSNSLKLSFVPASIKLQMLNLSATEKCAINTQALYHLALLLFNS